ncbi:hypothetical protein E3N88_35022 [Mikania micrantha]|uniref:Putative plant transposon protein domain-containing protein n=1 Tax=Mikania micrantha TaxID=192012 RepID=A0A5N6M074_9ASTR|nr:hypothetical protein E3N88_35022 [Mikania micrantha]
MVMSRENLNHVARFDSKPSNQYVYPSMEDLQSKPALYPTWSTMLQTFFEPGKWTTMRRNNLRIEAKLLLAIIHMKVVPRRGDKTMVRHPEVPVLYALMIGGPKISFRYLAMLNIWEAHNNKEKNMIPHCKLIQALIRWYGLINDDDQEYMRKYHTPFRLNTLNTLTWEYKSSERYHRLKDVATGRVWDVLKVNARPLQPGEHDTFDGEAMGVEVNMATSEEDEDNEGDDRPISSMIGKRRGEGSSRGQLDWIREIPRGVSMMGNWNKPFNEPDRLHGKNGHCMRELPLIKAKGMES